MIFKISLETNVNVSYFTHFFRHVVEAYIYIIIPISYHETNIPDQYLPENNGRISRNKAQKTK